MTNEERKVIELAIEWIEKQPKETPESKYDVDTRYVVLRELEAALAQPEQEYGVVAGVGKGVEIPAGVKYYYIEPKLPSQPKEQDQDEVDIRSRLYQRIHELETQLAQSEQEPVAWMYESVCGNDFSTCIDPPSYAKNIRPLYTTPPQRTWVGLTDEEMEEIRKQAVDLFVQEVKTTGKGRNEPIKFGRLVEAKIKDKNL